MKRATHTIASRLAAAVAVTALLLAGAQPASAASGSWTEGKGSFGTENYLPAFRAPSGLSIDGDLSEWGDTASIAVPQRDDQVQLPGWSGASDLSVISHTAYDDDNLYLSFEITDDVHSTQTGSSMWRGDSIQLAFSPGGAYGPEYTVAVIDGTAEVIRGAAGSATADADLVTAVGSTVETTTTLEIAMPWATVAAAIPSDGAVPFTFLVNDNDGSGRRGWVEWTAGIGKAKTPALHGEIELLPESRDWSGWLTGPTEATTGSAETYSLSTFNAGSVDQELVVHSDALGIDESIVVPAGSIVTSEATVTFGTPGSAVVDVTWSSSGGGVRRDAVTVQVADSAADITDALQSVESRLPSIESLLEQAETQQIATDYARVQYSVLERFVQYGRDDLVNGRVARASYVATELTSMADQVTSDLESYLAGEAEPLAAPRYSTGSLTVDGRSIIGDTVTRSTGEEATGPVFLTGYGHFDQVRKDVPGFQDLGANIIQIEIGPKDVVVPASAAVEQFNVNRSGNVDATVEQVTGTAHGGTTSLKIDNRSAYASNVFVNVVQNIAVQPNTTYTFDAWVKGTEVKNAWFPGGTGWTQRIRFPNGTYDWTKVTATYTTGASESTFPLTIFSENTGTTWIDDVSVTAAGSTTNLVKNGDFEVASAPGSNPEWRLSSSKLQSSVVDVLNNAAASDVAVNLLLSPHYFPAWALAKWPDLATTNTGSIKYSIDAPIARQIVEDYVRTVVRAVKDSPALQSITLTNEPVYQANRDPDAVPDWHAYLAAQYANVATLNSAYGTGYAAFDEVPMPTAVRGDVPSYDYVLFNNDRFAAWHEWLADIVDEEAPGLLVHAKMMADATGSLSWGVDVERMSRLSDLIGDDNWNYIDEGAKGFYEELAFYDLQQSFGSGPVFNSEQHVIADGDQYYGPEQADHVRSVLWQSAVHGRSASTMWIWERSYDANSSREGSILHRPDVVEAIGETNLDLNRLANEVTAFQEAAPRVAILSSLSSSLLSSESVGVSQRAYEAISTAGVEVGFVSEAQAQQGGLDGYDLVVVPASGRVAATTLSALNSYTATGGEAVVIGTHALEKSPLGTALSPAERQAVIDRSTYIPAAATVAADLRTAIAPILDQLMPDRVAMTDSVGDPLESVEWRSVQVDGKTFVNVVNYGADPVQVRMSQGGSPLAPAHEMIADQDIPGLVAELIPLTPYLFEVQSVTPPGAPEAVGVVTGNGVAKVSWTAPGDDGGAPITGYAVTEKSSGFGCLATTETSCRITGLVAGRSYTFSVVAESEGGTSQPTTAQPATPSLPPGTTGNVSLSVSAAIQCQLSGPAVAVHVLNKEGFAVRVLVQAGDSDIDLGDVGAGQTVYQLITALDVEAGTGQITGSGNGNSATYDVGWAPRSCA